MAQTIKKLRVATKQQSARQAQAGPLTTVLVIVFTALTIVFAIMAFYYYG